MGYIPVFREIIKKKGWITMKKIFSLAMVFFVGAFLLVSCSGGKNAADIAIKAAEEAVNATKAEAEKVVPNEVKSLENALAAVKDKFNQKEYKAALEEATALSGKAKEVLDAAKAKKEELTKKWGEISQELPKMVAEIQGKVDELSKLKKLPKTLTKEAFEEAKTGLAAVQDEWSKIQQSFTSGNFSEAITAAATLKDKVVKIMESLGISAPSATPAPAGHVSPAPEVK